MVLLLELKLLSFFQKVVDAVNFFISLLYLPFELLNFLLNIFMFIYFVPHIFRMPVSIVVEKVAEALIWITLLRDIQHFSLEVVLFLLDVSRSTH